MKGSFTNIAGDKVEIIKDEIHTYRGTDSQYKCVVYMKDGSEHYLKETFEQVDKVFDLLTPPNYNENRT